MRGGREGGREWGGRGEREGGREGGSNGKERWRGDDEYTYRTNLTLSTHLEVIEGQSKMKNFRKLLCNSLGERDREKAQLTEVS